MNDVAEGLRFDWSGGVYQSGQYSTDGYRTIGAGCAATGADGGHPSERGTHD